MDLNALRNNYAIGAYSSIATSTSSLDNNSLTSNPEAISLIWKSILRSSGGDVSKCATFLQSTQSTSDLLKKSLMLWSKAFKLIGSSFKGDDLVALRELAGKAQEAIEMDQEERDQIILTCAEALLMSSASNESFKLLKLLKASNLDSQIMYVDILVQLGQVKMARDRLEKMKNIPEWKDDVRFLLSEALLGLYNNSTTSSDYDDDGPLPFSVKDSLYSYQELVQVHGATPFLLCHLAAGYILIGKYQEASNTLHQIDDSSEICDANLLVTSALLNNPNFSLKEFKSKYPNSKLLNL